MKAIWIMAQTGKVQESPQAVLLTGILLFLNYIILYYITPGFRCTAL